MPRAAARAGGLIGVVLLFAALVVAKNTVTAADGSTCVSAYRAARGKPSFGGEIPDEERVRHAALCQEAARPVMRWAYALAAAGGVLAVVAVGFYVVAARPRAA